MDRLARFRADPSKIHVRVRRYPNGWLAAFIPSAQGAAAFGTGRTAVRAVVRAFMQAKQIEMPGLDPSMGWAYVHPQWKP